MSYQVRIGDTARVLHPVRTFAGNPLGGVAGTITKTLKDPTGATSGLTVTVVELYTGWYELSFSPVASPGAWVLHVQNPVGSDELQTDYVVTVLSQTVVASASGLWLTTRARVKERLEQGGATIGTQTDTLIDSLISESSAKAHSLIGGIIPEQGYIHTVRGSGGPWLTLPEGPLVSVSLVESLVQSSDAAGARVVTATTIPTGHYSEAGRLEDGNLTQGMLYYEGGGPWDKTYKYRVTYTGGFDPIPEDLVHGVTNYVLAKYLGREAEGLRVHTRGDGGIEPSAPDVLERALRATCAPYFRRMPY